MTRVSIVTLLLALGLSASAYAQAPAKPAAGWPAASQTLHTDYQTLNTDDDEIRALDRKRDEALRSNNPKGAEQIQAQIDKLRASRKSAEQNINKEKAVIAQEKMTAEEKCARDPACAAKKKREEVERQLQSYKQQLANDETAAARVSQDKATIAKLEAELK